ncbi:MAG: alpha/beta hydrolase [Leptolyngbyaceae cyanobacterium SM2_3_12]|nr:alpha/beta hydrolase [Leptolyngbyaceae cyanobacterium SM2_3_12]
MAKIWLFFINLLSPEQRADLRTALTTSREANVVRLSQWFNTPMGERTLLFAGKLVETGARLNSQRALRSALVAAAAEDGDISVLDILRHFPTQGLRLDLDEAVRKARQVIQEADDTLALVAAIRQKSTTDAALPPPFDLAALPDLTQPGRYPVDQIDLTLVDPSRTGQALSLDGPRTFPATLFTPQDLAAVAELSRL